MVPTRRFSDDQVGPASAGRLEVQPQDGSPGPRRRACLRAALRGFCADLAQAGGRWADAVAVADGTPAPPRDDADAEDASARVPPAHRGAAWQALEVAVAGVREVGIDGA